MECLQRYDGNVHPELWVKKSRAFCLLNKIYEVQLKLRFCIEMINTTIVKIPNNIVAFDELINALKKDISFMVFKDTCKRKLQSLKYFSDDEYGDTSKFIAEFRMFCFGAEINNLEELKQYLFQSIPSHCRIYNDDDYRNVASMDELIRLFNNVASNNINVIRTGSVVKLKHIASGKYLSCRYKNGPAGYEMVCIKIYIFLLYTIIIKNLIIRYF